MSANEKGWAFTGGDYAIGVHGDRFVKGVAAIHTHAAAQRPGGRPSQKAEQEIKRCAGTPRVHPARAHACDCRAFHLTHKQTRFSTGP